MITFSGDTDEWVRFVNQASWSDLQQKSIFQRGQFTADQPDLGRSLWKTQAGTAVGWSVIINQTETGVEFAQTADGGVGRWRAVNAGVVIPDNYFSLGVSMDLGDINNTPEMYINGIPTTNSEENTPSGVWHSDGTGSTDYITLGNADNGEAGYIGTLGGGLLFNTILTPANFAQLHAGLLTLDLLESLVYAPLLLGSDGKQVFTGALSSSNFVYCHMTGAKGTPSGSPIAVPESRLAFPFAYG